MENIFLIRATPFFAKGWDTCWNVLACIEK